MAGTSDGESRHNNAASFGSVGAAGRLSECHRVHLWRKMLIKTA